MCVCVCGGGIVHLGMAECSIYEPLYFIIIIYIYMHACILNY